MGLHVLPHHCHLQHPDGTWGCFVQGSACQGMLAHHAWLCAEKQRWPDGQGLQGGTYQLSLDRKSRPDSQLTKAAIMALMAVTLFCAGISAGTVSAAVWPCWIRNPRRHLWAVTRKGQINISIHFHHSNAARPTSGSTSITPMSEQHCDCG